jgi:hypothetical protein
MALLEERGADGILHPVLQTGVIADVALHESG